MAPKLDRQEWLGLLEEDPELALLRLVVAFQADRPSFEAEQALAVDRWEAEGERIGEAIEAFEAAGSLGPTPEELLDGLSWLALLRFADLLLARSMDGAEPAASPRRIGDARYWVRRRPRNWRTGSASQLGHLQTFLEHHWVTPCSVQGIGVELRSAPPGLLGELSGESLVLWAAPFYDGIGPDWQEKGGGLWCERLTDPEGRWASLQAVLEAASESGASVLLLPELTVCPAALDRMSDWLELNEHSLELVVPGSFHFEAGEERPRNITRILDRDGHELLRQEKLNPVGWLPPRIRERIGTGTVLRLLETRVGSIAVPICRDYCEEDEPFGNLWLRAGVEWALVPSMGDLATISAHQKRAGTLLRLHATRTVVANQHTEFGPPSHPEASPVWLLTVAPGAGPTRFEQRDCEPFGRALPFALFVPA